MLVVGDEILDGHVHDANSPWLAQRLRQHGVPLTRVHVVPDELEAIGEALRAELARSRPRVVLTSGGVGSTPDDLTYEAVAAGLGRPLVEEPTITARLAELVERSRERGLDTSEQMLTHLRRMALVPDGSEPLVRPGGWVPCVAVPVDGGCHLDEGATVVVLPGVPEEFRALVEQVVEPAMLAGRNPVPSSVEVTHGLPESALNPTFAAMLERFPAVRLGSYPGRPMLVRLTGHASDVDAAAAMLRAAIDVLEAAVADAGPPSAPTAARRGGEEQA